MKKRVSACIRKFLCRTRAESLANTSNQTIDIDVREEYAHAFRTESYVEFWTHVVALSNQGSTKCTPTSESSTTATRLSSYRLFTEQLLEPDQNKVTRILSLTENHPLLLDYFVETANTFLLFSLLLKDIKHLRRKYKSFRIAFNSLENIQVSSISNFKGIKTRLTEFSCWLSPFDPSAPSPSRVRVIQTGSSELLKRIESTRDKARAKLRLINISKHGSAIFLVALTTSLTVIVVTHGLVLLVAAPSLIVASMELASPQKLAKLSVQLDAAAKGTYILTRDLDTISRLMTRLNDELEHMRSIVKFWLEGEEGRRLQASGEVARQLKKNDASFSQQLDELEEHLYLCFMTVNRARKLVLKEILDPGQPTTSAPNFISNYNV